MTLPQFRLLFFCLIFQISGGITNADAAPNKAQTNKPASNSAIESQALTYQQTNNIQTEAIPLETELATLRTQNKQITEALQKANEDFQQLKQMSGQAIYLNQTNQKMREELEMQKIEVEKLTQQNRQLSEDNRVDGIIQGTIAVLVGALLTLFIPRVTNRKSFSSWH